MPNFPNEDLRVGFVQVIEVEPKVVSPELASRSLIPFVWGIIRWRAFLGSTTSYGFAI